MHKASVTPHTFRERTTDAARQSSETLESILPTVPRGRGS